MNRGRTSLFKRSIHQRSTDWSSSNVLCLPRGCKFNGRVASYLLAAASFLFSVFVFQAEVFASDVTEFIGRRVTRVDVVIEGAPNSNVAEMRTLVDVAPGQDYSPVRI